jgi:predicted nucleic acid-binding protein
VARYVIDALTLLHLVDRSLPVAPDVQLVAPHRIRSEVLELLLRDVVRGARDEKVAVEVHQRMTELRMRLLGDRVSRGTAWKLARQHGWETLRDAEYLAIARLQADALVTVDPELAEKAEGVVALAPVQDLLVPA